MVNHTKQTQIKPKRRFLFLIASMKTRNYEHMPNIDNFKRADKKFKSTGTIDWKLMLYHREPSIV